MIKTIFFDWGGVIATDPGDDFLSNLLKQIGASDEQIKEIFQKYMSRFTRGTISESDYWAELKEHYGFEIPDTISEEFIKWKGLVANEAILGLVDELRGKGYKVVVFSNVIEPSYEIIKKAGYYDRFDAAILSFQEGLGKPDKEIYDIALQKMGASAEESLFIDDKQSFLDPAIEAGWQTILAVNPEQIMRDVRQRLLS